MSFKPNAGDIFLNKYEIVSLIGEGAFGCVYRARDVKLDRIVAIKFINIVNDVLERFNDEIEAIKGLDHPNIVRLYDFDILKNGMPCMVMEYINGREVGDVLCSDGPFELQRICEIALQVLDALVETHKHGIVHCDLKPENIMLSNVGARTDVVKLIDFGVASIFSKTANDPKRAKVLVGTPQYMAPEQIRHEEIGPWTDIYAVGLILIELFTGQFVFDAEDPREVLRMQLHKPVVLPPKLANTELGPIIARAVEKDKNRRYQSTKQLYDDLKEASLSILTLKRQQPHMLERVQNMPLRSRASQSIFDDFEDFYDDSNGLTSLNPSPSSVSPVIGGIPLLGRPATGMSPNKSLMAEQPQVPSQNNLRTPSQQFSGAASQNNLRTPSQQFSGAASQNNLRTPSQQFPRPSSQQFPRPSSQNNLRPPSQQMSGSISQNIEELPQDTHRRSSQLSAEETYEALGFGSINSALESLNESANAAPEQPAAPEPAQEKPSDPAVPLLAPAPAPVPVAKLARQIEISAVNADLSKSSEPTRSSGHFIPAKKKIRVERVLAVFAVIAIIVSVAVVLLIRSGLLQIFENPAETPRVAEHQTTEVQKPIVQFASIRHTGETMANALASAIILGNTVDATKLTTYRVIGTPTDAAIYVDQSLVCASTPCNIRVLSPENAQLIIRRGQASKSAPLKSFNPKETVFIVLDK